MDTRYAVPGDTDAGSSLKKIIAAVINAAAAKLSHGLNVTDKRTTPFVQHTNPVANNRRKIKRKIGARQYRIERKLTLAFRRSP